MRFFDRVAQFTSTVGQGSIVLGTPITNAMLSLAEAGAVDGDEVTFLLDEGDNFEISRGIVGGGGATVTRDTVQVSKIGGIAGTAKLELAGSAQFRVVETAFSLNRFETNIGYQALLPEVIKTAGWTATAAEAGRMLVYNSAIGGAVVLPPVAASNGEVYHYRCANTGSLTIDGNAAETVEGAATLVLPRGCSALIWANEGKTGWRAMVTPPPAVSRLPGAAGAFLRFTGADTAAMQALVGAVSQSGGVPTGAIVERGSNANGEYVRFLDGTQLCWHSLFDATGTTTAIGSMFWSAAEATWVLPAAFTTALVVQGAGVRTDRPHGIVLTSSGPGTVGFRFWSATSLSGTSGVRLVATGRWN